MQRMKELIEKVVKGYGDYIAMALGSITLILSFVFDAEELWLRILIFLSGFIGFMYAACALYYLIKKRPLFDWYLLHGHFLRKVCCLVMLMPSSLAVISVWAKIEPKMLTYEEALYECGDKQLPCDIKREQESPNIFWSTYYHFIDPGNQHMTTTQWGRCWAAIVAILGILLLNGLLVSSLIGWFDNRKEKWLNGKVKYPCFLRKTPHYVIVGGNDMVAGIVMQLFTQSSKDDSKKEAADDNADKELADDNSDKESAEDNADKELADDNADKESANVNADKELPYILIQTSRDVDSFRRELFSNLKVEQQQRVIIYYGNRTSTDDIKDLILESAEEVYILGEDTRTDDIESYHDTMNMKCLELVSKSIKDVETINKDSKLICRVMFEYQTTFNILQVTDIDGDKIEFLPFNYYEMWAQNVLICQELEDESKCKYLPLEGFDGIKSNDEKFVHLVVVGMSRMGIAMAIETAHLAHYPNFETDSDSERTNKIRTRITFIDASMDKEKHFFMGRFKEMFYVTRCRDIADITNATEDLYNDINNYPWLNPLTDLACKSPYYNAESYLGKDFVDIEWEFLNGSIENPHIQQYLSDAAANDNAKLTIAICLPENSRAIAAAAYMPDSVYKSNSTIQVLVYQRLNEDLLCQINHNKRYNGKLKAFGMVSLCYNAQLVKMSEDIAKKIEDAYEQYNWENLKLRYNGKGLIDDDYDYLSNNIFGDNTAENKKQIKYACDSWMQEFRESPYSDVAEPLECLQKSIAEYKKKDEKSPTDLPTTTCVQSIDKPKSSKMWSNQYNVYSMWTKFRCFGLKPNNVSDISSKLSELGKMEHNRWVVEQLLLRYRPLNDEEQKEAQMTDLYASAKIKRDKKNKFAHLDICSNDVLDSIDYNISKLDQELIKALFDEYIKYLADNA